jgi:hypothetical protein
LKRNFLGSRTQQAAQAIMLWLHRPLASTETILSDVRKIPQSQLVKCLDTPSNRPRPIHSKFFIIHHSPTIPSSALYSLRHWHRPKIIHKVSSWSSISFSKRTLHHEISSVHENPRHEKRKLILYAVLFILKDTRVYPFLKLRTKGTFCSFNR